jgi:hypothetical protein
MVLLTGFTYPKQKFWRKFKAGNLEKLMEKESCILTEIWEESTTINFDYSGIKGLTIVENPTTENTIIEQRNDQNQLVFRLDGQNFRYKENGDISGQKVKVSIYLEKDSIFHPGINVKFQPEKKMILYSGQRSLTRSPFYDSYHKLFIFSDQVHWLATENAVVISPSHDVMSGKRRIHFESSDYFDADYFYRIQNIADYHPMVKMKLLSEAEGTTILPIEKLAQYINPKFTESHIKSLLFDLESYGFLQYDLTKKEVHIYDKLFQYVKASKKTKDADILKIISESETTNGRICLKTKELQLEGVKNMPIQQRQMVGIKPKKKQISIGENRNTEFDGKVFAGFANFTGKDMAFDYDKFQIEMDSIHFLDFFIADNSVEKQGKPSGIGVTSRIENVSGILFVNAPENKSGRELIANFPAFRSTRAAHIYYDLNNEQGDCYQKEDFYFELEEFQFNSLANFTESDLNFRGKLISSGIFPDFEETIVFQKHDRSLGFVTKTPEEGYSTYLEKGAFKGNIQLSNRGLEGKGELKYEATTLLSEDIIFKPDELICTADSFYLKADAERSIPEAYGEAVEINWLPKSDSMFINSQNKSFHLFNDGEHQIGGMLIYTPDGLKGKGIFEWSQGEMTANLFSFGSTSVTTEKTDLKIKTLQDDGVAFDTRDLNGKIDFESKKGRFKANNATSITAMPYNQYITTLNEFEWDLGKKALTLVAESGKKGTFISTHPSQDSLKFEGTTANYDFETSEMNIKGVPFILVADALVYPAKNHVKINADGYVKQLENAEILADFENHYHSIYQATVNISSRHHFTAVGRYDYSIPSKKQVINFTNIVGKQMGKDKTGNLTYETSGKTALASSDDFYLAEKTRYQGEIAFKSSDKHLRFDGFAQLDVPVLKNQEWFAVEFNGDKNKMLVANETPKSKAGNTLFTGIYLSKETKQNYAALLMPKEFKKDRPIFEAPGVIRYDLANDAFVFGDAARLRDEKMSGNQLTFACQTATLVANGKFDICPNLEGINLQIFGQMQTGFPAAQLNEISLANSDISTNWAATFSPGFSKSLQKILLADLMTNNADRTTINKYKKETYESLITHLIPAGPKRDAAYHQLVNAGALTTDFGKETPFFLLTELAMEWNDDLASFVLKNNEIGVAALNGQKLAKKLPGYLEFHYPGNELDKMKLYIESGDYYYYFGFQKGLLSINSNNPEFQAAFKKMEKSNKIKGSAKHNIQWTTGEIVYHFKRRMKGEN